MLSFGLFDVHCINCGNFALVSAPQAAGKRCDRCGAFMDMSNPTDEVREAREHAWMKSPEGQRWRRLQRIWKQGPGGRIAVLMLEGAMLSVDVCARPTRCANLVFASARTTEHYQKRTIDRLLGLGWIQSSDTLSHGKWIRYELTDRFFALIDPQPKEDQDNG